MPATTKNPSSLVIDLQTPRDLAVFLGCLEGLELLGFLAVDSDDQEHELDGLGAEQLCARLRELGAARLEGAFTCQGLTVINGEEPTLKLQRIIRVRVQIDFDQDELEVDEGNLVVMGARARWVLPEEVFDFLEGGVPWLEVDLSIDLKAKRIAWLWG